MRLRIVIMIGCNRLIYVTHTIHTTYVHIDLICGIYLQINRMSLWVDQLFRSNVLQENRKRKWGAERIVYSGAIKLLYVYISMCSTFSRRNVRHILRLKNREGILTWKWVFNQQSFWQMVSSFCIKECQWVSEFTS